MYVVVNWQVVEKDGKISAAIKTFNIVYYKMK